MTRGAYDMMVLPARAFQLQTSINIKQPGKQEEEVGRETLKVEMVGGVVYCAL